MSKSRKGLIIALITILAVVVLVGAMLGFITDYLWFKELGYTSVFFKQLLTQLKIGVPTFLILGALTFLYLRALKRGYFKRIDADKSHVNEKSLNGIATLFSVLCGGVVTYLAVTKLWFEALKFYHSSDFNMTDPIFNMDISFYVFKLQFIKDINELLISAIIVFAVLTFIFYFILISMARPKAFDSKAQTDEERFKGDFNQDIGGGQNDSGLGGIFNKFTKGFGQQMGGGAGFKPRKPASNIGAGNFQEILHIASKQIMVIGVIFFLMLGVNFFLRQYELLYSGTGVLYGAGYTDINITLWVYRALIVLSVLAAVMFVVGMNKKKYRTMLTVPVIMIIVGALGTGAGLLVQTLVVSPDEINKENEYLGYNIEYTQTAYDLDEVSVTDFAASNELTKEDIQSNESTINNIRINDYGPAEKFYNQTQAIRKYYSFNDVDVDRYMVNGEYTQTFLSAREIDDQKISQEWINKYIKYTHGYGITLSRVDKVTSSGQPDVLIKDFPPTSQIDEIEIDNPAIYFGELTNDYVLTNTDEEEFDYPKGNENVYTEYDGNAGIKLGFLNKALFAIKEQSMKLLVSSNINSDSKIIINRNIEERVKKIMPYLQYDSDPYIVTVDGKLYWMMDAYTTSSYYPYSEPFNEEQSDVNYIRNSIKVVIDAYNGDTNYYLVDNKDPVANTLKNIYPKLFKDFSEMPEELQKHIRYPNDLLNIQANVYKRYHVDDVRVFYQGEDLWAIAEEIYETETTPMTPQYYIMKMPGEEDVEFVNSIPYTPQDKRNMTGLLVARNDGDNYGKLVLYKMPKSKLVYGPMQIEAQINQHPTISQDFTLWDNAGSQYSRGNMFIVPIEDSFLYVEPIYLEAEDGSLPEVKKVIVAYGDRIAYENTLAESLNSLFGEGSNTPSEGSDEIDDTTNQATTDDTPSSADLIQAASDAYDAAVAAQKEGDWTKYGEELDKLEEALNQLDAGSE